MILMGVEIFSVVDATNAEFHVGLGLADGICLPNALPVTGPGWKFGIVILFLK